MAHYGTLSDYRFTEDVDDVRGASVYDRNGEKLGKVKDVILDHESGEIRYLVVDIGKWKILVPSGRVFRSAADEDDFETTLSRSDADQLPEFDDSSLKDEKRWAEQDRRHEDYWKKHDEQYMKEYKAKYEERGGVMHRKDSERIVTPEPDEMPAPPATTTTASGKTVGDASQLFPQRLADKFAGVHTPLFGAGYEGPKTTETVRRSTDDEGALAHAGLPSAGQEEQGGSNPRWSGFQQNVRRNVSSIRTGCGLCGCKDEKVA